MPLPVSPPVSLSSDVVCRPESSVVLAGSRCGRRSRLGDYPLVAQCLPTPSERSFRLLLVDALLGTWDATPLRFRIAGHPGIVDSNRRAVLIDRLRSTTRPLH